MNVGSSDFQSWEAFLFHFLDFTCAIAPAMPFNSCLIGSQAALAC